MKTTSSIRRALWLVASLLPATLAARAHADVLAAAHRGLTSVAPENTLAAFVAARGKSDMVEMDVRVSGDGQLVVIHDATVDRTTDGSGTVSNMTLAELRSLDAGSWYSTNFAGQRIPTFNEMINAILPYATPLIEHKTGSPAQYVQALQDLGAADSVMLQSFEWLFLKAVRELDPSIRTCALATGPMTYDMLAGAVRNGAGTVAWYKVDVTSEGVALAHSLGLKVFVWTVAEPEIASLLALGVDGIITDAPEKVILAQHPTPAVDVTGLRHGASADSLQIDVHTTGLASNVGLLRADAPFLPFTPAIEPAVSHEGRDRRSFTFEAGGPAAEFFRVTAE